MKKLNNKGFTLIELLVVVLIIGILSAIAIPKYLKAAERTKASEANTVLGAISHAQALYFLQNPPNYATAFANLDVDLSGGTVSDDTYTTENFVYTLGDGKITAVRRNDDAYTLGLTYSDGSMCCTEGEGSNLHICPTLHINNNCI